MCTNQQSQARSGNTDAALLWQVRAAFIARGITLNKWCRANGVLHCYAHRVLIGARNGPKAKALRKRICEAVGVQCHDMR